MTKRDYELIAKVIASLHIPYPLWVQITNAFTIALAGAKNNRTFNSQRFRRRCAKLDELQS